MVHVHRRTSLVDQTPPAWASSDSVPPTGAPCMSTPTVTTFQCHVPAAHTSATSVRQSCHQLESVHPAVVRVFAGPAHARRVRSDGCSS
ncbi:hypothetical protein C8T65DRAFT_628300 [Cerioporus squamosus]|nr:hypothetical protein C8T65DRAFT_628300 [Cerioporus squamosus]